MLCLEPTSYGKAQGLLCMAVDAAQHACICIIRVYRCNIDLACAFCMRVNCFFEAPFLFKLFLCEESINLKNAASALCLAAWLLRAGTLFAVLISRTGFRGVYTAN